MKDKWETSEGNHATNQTQSGRQAGDSGRQMRQMKDKWETSERNQSDQPDPEWKTSGRQMKEKWETSEGNHLPLWVRLVV